MNTQTRRPVASLWIGEKLHYLNQLCLLSHLRHGHPTTLYCTDKVSNVPDGVEVRVDGVEAAFTGRVRFIAADASFTPYFALTRYDRGRLVYVAEIDLSDADDLPAGVPLETHFHRE